MITLEDGRLVVTNVSDQELGEALAGINHADIRTILIKDCPLMSIAPDLRNCTALTELWIDDCPLMSSAPDLRNCTALTELRIEDCPRMPSAPDLRNCTALTELWIEGCPLMPSAPDLRNCTALIGLWIMDCPLISSVPDLHNCTALTTLWIEDCPRMSIAPDLRNCTALTILRIEGCPLMPSAPDLRNCTALTTLWIINCPRLNSNQHENRVELIPTNMPTLRERCMAQVVWHTQQQPQLLTLPQHHVLIGTEIQELMGRVERCPGGHCNIPASVAQMFPRSNLQYNGIVHMRLPQETDGPVRPVEVYACYTCLHQLTGRPNF